jgi:addiction module RelE/StbE family toxin
MLSMHTTPRFERMLGRFVKAHPELRQKTLSLINRLAKNPRDPRNKTHSLTGKLKGCLAASISFHYRIVFVVVDDALWLLSVGSHDEVY